MRIKRKVRDVTEEVMKKWKTHLKVRDRKQTNKLEHLSNWGRCFLFHFKSSFRSQENPILEFYILKFHDVIKCLSIKQEIHFTE